MESKPAKKRRGVTDWVLLGFVCACAILISLTIGTNLVSELSKASAQNTIMLNQIQEQKNSISREDAYNEWLNRTSGGRKIE